MLLVTSVLFWNLIQETEINKKAKKGKKVVLYGFYAGQNTIEKIIFRLVNVLCCRRNVETVRLSVIRVPSEESYCHNE
jgi:hypothetical protein